MYSAADQCYHLLLDDVSATHVEATRRPPTVEYALALADGLAAMHARWWGADRLAAAGRPIHDAGQVQHFVDIAAPGVPHVLERCTTELAGHWPGMIRQVIARHPGAMIERTRNADGFSIIHGDPGCTNILVPRAGSRPLYLIDRQPFNWSLTTWLGIYDLVYATVLDWPVADRRRLEKPLLRRYHDQLLAHGVDGYSWDQLWTDYRLMIPIGGTSPSSTAAAVCTPICSSSGCPTCGARSPLATTWTALHSGEGIFVSARTTTVWGSRAHVRISSGHLQALALGCADTRCEHPGCLLAPRRR